MRYGGKGGTTACEGRIVLKAAVAQFVSEMPEFTFYRNLFLLFIQHHRQRPSAGAGG
jgi:hypothetical protein